MADTRDFAQAEAATSAACAEYLLHSALDATQLLHRYQQLMGAVARQQISPARASEPLQNRAYSSAAITASEHAISAFTESLGQSCFVSSNAAELDDTVGANVIMRHQRAFTQYTEQIAALADPTIGAGARRRALTRSQAASANHLISNAAAQWFTVLSALGGAQARALAPALLDALRLTQPAGFEGHVVEFAGAIGSDVETSITISNERDEPTSVQFAMSELRRADGVGPAFTARSLLSPAHAYLVARDVGSVTISVSLDTALFAADTTYVGALTVTHTDGSSLDIPLRITTHTDFA